MDTIKFEVVLKEVPNFVKKLEETTVINDVQVGSPHFHFIDSSQIKGKSLYFWLLDEIDSILETVVQKIFLIICIKVRKDSQNKTYS